MAQPTGFRCATCGAWHDELALAIHFEAPAYWDPSMAGEDNSELAAETCVIRDEAFFVHARILLPVRDSDEPFAWGVWVSLSETSFQRTLDLWDTPGREAEDPYFGWLSTDLPGYEPTTLLLRTQVHTQPVGERPLVELEATDHPLAVQQREGITLADVQALNAANLH